MDCKTIFPAMGQTCTSPLLCVLNVHRHLLPSTSLAQPTELWSAALKCLLFTSSDSHYLLQGLYACLDWQTYDYYTWVKGLYVCLLDILSKCLDCFSAFHPSPSVLADRIIWFRFLCKYLENWATVFYIFKRVKINTAHPSSFIKLPETLPPGFTSAGESLNI